MPQLEQNLLPLLPGLRLQNHRQVGGRRCGRVEKGRRHDFGADRAPPPPLAFVDVMALRRSAIAAFVFFRWLVVRVARRLGRVGRFAWHNVAGRGGPAAHACDCTAGCGPLLQLHHNFTRLHPYLIVINCAAHQQGPRRPARLAWRAQPASLSYQSTPLQGSVGVCTAGWAGEQRIAISDGGGHQPSPLKVRCGSCTSGLL